MLECRDRMRKIMARRLNPLIEEIFCPAARLRLRSAGWGVSTSLSRNLVVAAMFLLLNGSLAVETSLQRSFYATHYWLREDGQMCIRDSRERQADEIRRDGRAARPRLDRRLLVRGLRLLDFVQQAEIYKRTLFNLSLIHI